MTNLPPLPVEPSTTGINRITIKEKEITFFYNLDLVKQIRYIGVTPQTDNKKKLRKRALFSTSVPLGCLAVVAHGNSVYNHDGYAEVYLPGELIVKRDLTQEKEWRIVEIAFYPGYFELIFEKQLYTLTDDLPEVAKVIINCGFYVEDPIKLLSNHANWDTTEGNTYLINRVVNVITQSIEGYLQGEIQIWSSPDINTVAGGLMIYLDSKLTLWGLRMRPDFTAVRKYPESLSRIIYSFIDAEILFSEDDDALYKRMDLSNENIVKIQLDSKQYGSGTGLFNYFFSNINNLSKFDDYFRNNIHLFSPIVDYLKYARSSRTDRQDLALVNQIMRSYFVHPNLAIGEWAAT